MTFYLSMIFILYGQMKGIDCYLQHLFPLAVVGGIFRIFDFKIVFNYKGHQIKIQI